MRRLLTALLVLSPWMACFAQDHSVLATGDWYKLAIAEDGIYKLDYNFIKAIGIDPAGIDPKKLKLYTGGTGMLPQANATERPADLTECHVWVSGQEDGRFDAGDYVLFYGQGPEKYSYDEANTLQYTHHLYADSNYYFLTIGTAHGARVGTSTNEGNGFPKITSFNDFRYYEKELENLLKSGRKWYAEKYSTTTQRQYAFDLSNLMPNTEIKITSAVMAQSFAQSSFSLSVNGITAGNQTVESVPNFLTPATNNPYRYSVKGRESKATFTLNSTTVPTQPTLTLTVNYQKNSSGRSIGYLDFLQVEVVRNLQLYDHHTIFRSLSSLSNAFSTFEVGQATSTTQIWDITTPLNPRQQAATLAGTTLSFGAATNTLKTYVAFNPANRPAPAFVKKIAPQNLRGMSQPQLIIVTHPDFRNEAEQLAQFRDSHDNITTAVVTTEQIYNEFSSGKQDVVAIRDFVRHLYNKGSTLKYVLLFGRGSYDFKNVIVGQPNFVPTYESYNSLHPLDTYSSDDFFGFMDENEGEWLEVAGGNHLMDIGVGRLPVTTPEEAQDIVDKLIRYSTHARNYGTWRNEVLFVADDGDSNLHQNQANQLADYVENNFPTFNSQKLYLDSYPQVSLPGGERSPKAAEALTRGVTEKGALIVNFTGHGNEQVWMDEQLLTPFMVTAWKNNYKLPLFVTATCEFGRHDDPQRFSSGEMLLKNPKGGGIAIVSTCRPVLASSNFELNKAFYNAVFEKADNQYLRLGDIVRLTKNASVNLASDVNKVGNRNFALLGDPSLQLTYPEHNITITSLQDHTLRTDTLSALSKITIAGMIKNQSGASLPGFNGTLYASVYDKPTTFTTKGNENAPFEYTAKENTLFNGTARIENGAFTLTFIVPKNISYSYGKGKISLYAVEDDHAIDANGASIDIITGGSRPFSLDDTEGPGITLFIGDSLSHTHKVGGNTLLIAHLSDESGINISGYGIGNSLVATLDDSITYILNSYYTADLDTYQQGSLVFPINGLEKGSHRLSLKAWDTHNNSAEAFIDFVVINPNALLITELLNYPNPFKEETTIAFQHTRPGEDLQVNLQVISRQGEAITSLDFEIAESSAYIELYKWEGEDITRQKLTPGLYLIRLTVRSLLDGATNTIYRRIILTK